MKKIISLSLVALLILSACLMGGCGGSKEADLNAVLADINTSFEDATSGLAQLESVDDLNKYYMIDTSTVKQFAAEITSDKAKAPVEIVLVEANDAEGAKAIETVLNQRYQQICNTYSSYSPEEYEMAKNCGVTASGNYVTMIIAEDYDGILAKVNEAIA
ncbi:MAG: DUF4358 domain-containing protein [Ruminococcus sp.]